MKFSIFLALLISFSSYASSIKVNAHVYFYQQSYSHLAITTEAREGGWSVSENEDGEIYKLEKIIKVKDLPYKTGFGSTYLTISTKGKASIGAEIGDFDEEVTGSLSFFKLGNSFMKTPSPYLLEVGGGNYTRGSWSYEAKVSFTIIH